MDEALHYAWIKTRIEVMLRFQYKAHGTVHGWGPCLRAPGLFRAGAFSVAGPSVWNSLPADLRLEPDTAAVFKHKVKSYLFRSVFTQ